MLRIRKFQEGDERKLSYLSRKCTVLINSRDINKKELKFLYDHLTPGFFKKSASRGAHVFVAEYNGKVAGTATLDEYWIRLVFVNPTLHGKGIGKKLMTKIETTAKKLNLPFLQLKSSPFAKNFYKKLGYKTIKQIRNSAGTMTLMKKKLNLQTRQKAITIPSAKLSI